MTGNGCGRSLRPYLRYDAALTLSRNNNSKRGSRSDYGSCRSPPRSTRSRPRLRSPPPRSSLALPLFPRSRLPLLLLLSIRLPPPPCLLISGPPAQRPIDPRVQEEVQGRAGPAPQGAHVVPSWRSTSSSNSCGRQTRRTGDWRGSLIRSTGAAMARGYRGRGRSVPQNRRPCGVSGRGASQIRDRAPSTLHDCPERSSIVARPRGRLLRRAACP